MNICVPVNELRDGQSSVCAHFGSAPAFVVVDTEANSYKSVVTEGGHMCGAISTLQHEKVQALIVGGIGMGAINNLAAVGIQVFSAQHVTVEENIAAFKAGQLPLLTLDRACSQHGNGHGHGCGNHG